MSLPSSEHRRVARETKQRRNAVARARRWIAMTGAQVVAQQARGARLYTARLSGFHPITDRSWLFAIQQLRANVEHFVASPAAKGPTGARLDRLRDVLHGN